MRHMSDALAIDHVALAILRSDDQIVMVQQHNKHTDQFYWVLPGGLVEAGELINDALVREVQEETGVAVTAIERLVILSQIDRPAQVTQIFFFVFEVTHWHGTPQPHDPDGEVHRAELIPLEEAIRRLQQNGAWTGIQTPLLAYLRGEVRAGAMWFYREEADTQRLVDVLSPLDNR